MNTRSRLEPAFIPGRAGPLHTALFRADAGPSSDALLMVPPFAEEMNKCRPMMAMVCRRAAESGMDSLILDLFGTGDSAGDFRDATWEQWCNDVRDGWQFLKSRGATRIHLIGVRTGALLIAAVSSLETSTSKLVLWQPVLRGADYWRQFLRLRIAAQAMRAAQSAAPTPQEVLARDGEIEIAGYSVSASLITGLSSATFDADCIKRFEATLLLETTLSEPPALTGGVERVLAKWKEERVSIEPQVVAGEPFWSTPEIAKVPELVERTAKFLCETGSSSRPSSTP